MLTAADFVIVGIIAISAILSLLRGFVKEAISLIAWIGAFVIAGNFYQQLASKLTFIGNDLGRNAAAIIGLFILTLLVVGVCGNLIRTLISKAGLSGTDRLLGIVFGIVRGILVVCAILAVLRIGFKFHILTFLLEEP